MRPTPTPQGEAGEMPLALRSSFLTAHSQQIRSDLTWRISMLSM
jgi:hypothetical protein